MRDSGSEAAHRCELLARVQCLLEPLLLRDIANNLCSANDISVLILYGRDRQGHVYSVSSFGQADSLEVFNPFPTSNFFQNSWFIIMNLFREEDRNWFANDLFGLVAKN